MGNQATEKNKFEKEKALLLCVSKAVKKLSAVDKAHDFYSVQNEAGIDLRKKISKDKGNLDSPAVRYMIDKIIEIMTGNRSCNFRSYAEIQSSISEIGSYIEAIKAGDLYTVLSLGFRMSVPKCLVKKDAERIRDNGSGVIKRLYESTFRSRVYYMECGYIADVLYDLIEDGGIKAPPVDRYLLYAVQLSCLNSMGDSLKALKVIERIEEIEESTEIPLEVYYSTTNRTAETLCDMYMYERAYEKVSKALSEIEKRSGQMARTEYLFQRGNIFSAMARYLELQHKADVMKYYEEAIKCFQEAGVDGGMAEKDKSLGNIAITETHLMHYAAQTGDEDLFIKTFRKIYGKRKGIDDIPEIIEKCFYGEKVDLFRGEMLLKAYYRFGAMFETPIDPKPFLRIVREKEFLSEDFPPYLIKLIYKYVGLLLLSCGEEFKGESQNAFRISIEWYTGYPNKGKTYDVMAGITYQTIWIYNQNFGFDKDNKELLKYALEHMKNSDGAGWKDLIRYIEKEKSLENLYGFEYV